MDRIRATQFEDDGSWFRWEPQTEVDERAALTLEPDEVQQHIGKVTRVRKFEPIARFDHLGAFDLDEQAASNLGQSLGQVGRREYAGQGRIGFHRGILSDVP